MSELTVAQKRNISRIKREQGKPRAGWSKMLDWTNPKPVRGRVRCARLDSDGRRCLARAKVYHTVHADPEMYRSWWAVPMCAKHAASYDDFERDEALS